MTDNAAPQTIVSDEPFRLVAAAGGTGGHIFPAVAVVESLQELTHGRCSTIFLGSETRMETRLIPDLGYPYVSMPITGYRGLLSPSTWLLPWRVLRSVQIARAVIRRHRPHAVVVTGAYIAYPAGVAAALEGVPLIVLESNLNPGKSNTRLAKKATAIVVSFEKSRDYFPASLQPRIHVLGNPVRSRIDPHLDKTVARGRMGLKVDAPVVLVFGGSLGARRINDAIAASMQRLSTAPFYVLWQTGRDYEVPANVPDNVRVMPFIDDMGAAYTLADLVVSRSGATTIAELGIMARPAILIPLGTASTNEQHKNADVVTATGAAIKMTDEDVTEHLVTTMFAVMSNTEQRRTMSDAMGQFGKPHAARDTAQLVLDVSTWKEKQ